MAINENQFLMVFASYNQAMLLYSKLKEAGCDASIISTPCGLSRGCSQSIVFDIKHTKVVVEVAKSNNIKVAAIYKAVKNNSGLSYVAIRRA